MEYVALLALAAVVLGGAGAMVGLGEIGSAVASTVRTGICIVAGDVCRSSDAVEAGLEPCTVSDRLSGGGTTVAIGFVRAGEAGRTLVAVRSDGTVLVTETDEDSGGAVAGFGVEASPLGVDVGVEGGVAVTIAGGAAWEFPDLASAERFLASDDDSVPPTWRFGDVGGELSAEAKASFRGTTLAGIGATAAAASGARFGRDRATLYIRAAVDTGARIALPGPGGSIAGPSTGDMIIELTTEHGRPREIAFRRLGQGAGAGQVVDTVARLDLRDPANRRAAERVLVHALPWGESLADDLGALARLAVQRGTVERAVYEVRDDSSAFGLGVKVGVALGIDRENIDLERRLVAASAWTNGSQERLREDCLGVTTEPPEGTS
jgi:hypothetical protein